MNNIDLSNYLQPRQYEIYHGDITARIDELKTYRDGVDFDHGMEFADDDLAELTALIDFRDEVAGRTGNHFDEATIVPENLFAEHAREWAAEIAGGDADFLYPYVNWERFADGLKGDYMPVALGDNIVYVR